MDESSINQNRRSRRSNVLLTAMVEVAGEMLPVKLRNLSEDGALVEAKLLPTADSKIVFHRKELSVRGTVAWVSGNHAGIAFNRKLAPEQVLRHVPPPRPKLQIDFKRPGFNVRDFSPEQRKLIERWMWSPGPSKPGE
ncbi:MAG TPA: PilZ domain-containing protein [Sphingomicrobium sp.]